MTESRRTRFNSTRTVASLTEVWPQGDDSHISYGIADDELVLVENDQGRTLLIYKCPCGCGEDTNIPLAPYHSRGWVFEIDGDVFSLSPPVNAIGFPCKSHYFLRRNEVQWC